MLEAHGDAPEPRHAAPTPGVARREGEARVRQLLARAQAAVDEARREQAAGSRLYAQALGLAASSASTREASAALRAQLHDAVDSYVRLLRREDVPPERMLVLVKAIVHESAPTLRARDGAPAHAIADDVVRWSIEAYYAA